MIKFKCGKCGWQLDLPDKYAGKRVRCKSCKQISVVGGSQTGADGSTPRSADTPQEFMEKNYHVFQEMLKHEKEAPPIEDTDLR